MAKIDNVYIRKAKRKRFIKRMFILIILLIIGGTLFVTKTNVFKVDKIKCDGEILITESFILDKTKELNGENIFNINKKKVMSLLKGNPYIKSIDITKKIPRTVIINVKEKKGLYYINNNGEYNIISSDLVLLEKVDSIANDNLIEISGIDIQGKNIGEKIEESTRAEAILDELYRQQEEIKKQNLSCSITIVNIADLSNITINLNDIPVKIGSDEDIRKKMNKAINIYEQHSDKVKEYIDASFNGTPDFK